MHKLLEKDFDTKTAVCVVCGPVKLRVMGNAWMCEQSYRASRSRMRRTRTRKGMPPKKDHCEKCGFMAVDPCQLDQDHRSGDRTDNTDVWTLCANCHRLKSFRPDLF